MQDLLKAIGMYQDSVQQAATTNALNEASQFANEINMNITDEAQKRNVLQDMGNQLAMRLVGTGANASHIQAAFQAVQPKQFATPEAAIQEGVMTGNKGLQQLGTQVSDLVFNKQMKQAQIKDDLATKAEQRKFMREASIQMLKDRGGKQLTNEEIKPITLADTSLDSLDAIESLFRATDGWSVGPLAGNIPDVFAQKNSIAMETEVLRLQDSYRSLVTGAGAGDKELARLATRLPEMTDRPEVFNTKLQQFKIGMERYKERSLKNFGLAGRDISRFKEQSELKRKEAEVDKQIESVIKSFQIK
jgi:hypothetical protein